MRIILCTKLSINTNILYNKYISDKRDFIFEMIFTDRSIELLETENEDCLHIQNIETLKGIFISLYICIC